MLLFHAFNISTTRTDGFQFAHVKKDPCLFNEQESFFNQLFFQVMLFALHARQASFTISAIPASNLCCLQSSHPECPWQLLR